MNQAVQGSIFYRIYHYILNIKQLTTPIVAIIAVKKKRSNHPPIRVMDDYFFHWSILTVPLHFQMKIMLLEFPMASELTISFTLILLYILIHFLGKNCENNHIISNLPPT
jgi:hypothetical protein